MLKSVTFCPSSELCKFETWAGKLDASEILMVERLPAWSDNYKSFPPRTLITFKNKEYRVVLEDIDNF